MRGPGLPSFDQPTVFLSFVETGSFAAAGRRLGRATSAISYTIANLELQLGVPLFDRDRTRKPTLTEAGAAVLSLLLAGIGWGNMPEPIVRDDLAAGRLKSLDLPDGCGGFYALEAIYRTDTPPGPAAAWLIQRFSEQAKNVESRPQPSPYREHRPLGARGRDSHPGARARTRK